MRAARDGLVRTALAVGGVAAKDAARLLDDGAPGVREQARRAVQAVGGKVSTAPLTAPDSGESR